MPTESTSSAHKVLLIVGLALMGLGVVLGFLPISVNGGGTSCGSAFVESDDAQVDDLVDSMLGGDGGSAGDCADARSARQPLAIGALVLGGALTVGAVVMWPRKPSGGSSSSSGGLGAATADFG